MSQVTRRDEGLSPATTADAQVEIGMARAAQEVQAAMLIAQRFPRNEDRAYAKIIQGCKRKRLAEEAVYSYPRGGSMVSGPSIRLAEELARNWGNLDCGVTEIERRKGESHMMAYCHDLESNMRATRSFVVEHKRDTKKGSYALEDSRDIYEAVANQGARRLRACVLQVIPGFIVDDAVAECEQTLAGQTDTPLADRIKAMVAAFVGYGVDTDMLEARLGHRLSVTTEAEIVGLHKIFRSLRDNMAGADQFFDVSAAPKNGEKAQDLNRQLKKELDARLAAKATADKAAESPPPPTDAAEPPSDPLPADPPADPPHPNEPSQDQPQLAAVQAGVIRMMSEASEIDGETAMRSLSQWCVDVLDVEFSDITPGHAQSIATAIKAGAVEVVDATG